MRLSRRLAVFFTVTLMAVPWASESSLAAPKAQFSNLAKLQSKGARISALAINLRDGTILAELSPTQRLAPASLTKTLLAAAAFEKWGSEHSFKTKVHITGKRNNGKLSGDVIIEGAGDPYLTNEKLWFLATDVARLGIREVEGDLILNTSLFGDMDRDSNRAAGKRASSHAYDSPLSAAAVNFSVLAVVAGAGDSKSDPAFLGLEPFSMPGYRIQGKVSSGTRSQMSVSRVKQNAVDVLTAAGSAAIGQGPVRSYRSVSDADGYAGAVFRAFLEQAGVKIKGTTKVERTPLRSNARLLTEVDGFPLDWQIRGLFKVSNNFIGDMLTILLDTNERKQTGATLTGGSQQLELYMKAVLKKYDMEEGQGKLVVESGSGLTPENRLSARDFTTLFQHMFDNPREFPPFLAALPIPGAEGTVKKRFSETREKHLQSLVRAKTGTLSEPIDAVSLGGYCRLPNGDWAAFATIVNGSSSKPNVGIQLVHDAVDADLATIFPAEPQNGSQN